MPNDLKTLSPEYATLWDGMEIVRDHAQIERTVKKIIAFKAKYEAIEAATNVPWYVIGIMDMREAGGGCCKHLHNGDPLTAPTVQVPAKRPAGKGPFTWQESAIDALKIKKFDKITDWTIEQMAWCFERMNGFGYRAPDKNIPSPYLWGGTNHQSPGKYIADHVFSKTVMDQQIGCMPLLKNIAEMEGIELVSLHGATSDPSESSPASNRKAEKKPLGKVIADGMKENKEVIAIGGTVVGGVTAKSATDAPKEQPAPKADVKKHLEKAQDYKATAEQAKDIGSWVKSAATGPDAMLFGAVALVGVGLIGYHFIKGRS